jgi:hypothetical protein
MDTKGFIEQILNAGSASTDPHYPMGWSMTGNTPFKRPADHIVACTYQGRWCDP